MQDDFRVMIGYPNRIDEAVLYGGAYVEAMPLANLQDRQFARVARTISTAVDATRFDVDLGRQRSIRILALIAHTISTSGRLRIRASNNADMSEPVYDRTVDAWPGLSSADWDIDTLEWENDNYWLGTTTPEETEGQTAVASHILPEAVVARYWRFNVMDPINPDGFIDIGRLFIGDAFLRPRINMSWGASLGLETETAVQMALSGAEYFDAREPVRVKRFTLEHLTAEEGYAKALELTRRAGTHKEVFFVDDPSDRIYGALRNFLGRLRSLSPLEQAMWMDGGIGHSMAFEIKELR